MVEREGSSGGNAAIGRSHSPHRAAIDPLEESAERPLWSVMIPAYNCADHLGAAIESVLAQDPGPERMQIEVVDDCSDDGTADVAARFGDRVSLFRQPRNLGNVGNFNACLARARGHLIHLLHGDDAVRPGFYERLQAPLSGSDAIGAAFCRYIAIDGDGNWTGVSPLESAAAGVLDGWVETLALGQRLQPPCIAVRREAYERLGGFDDRISYSEDWEMWTRIAGAYEVWHDPAPLALYRVHEGTISDRTLRSGANVADLRRAIEMNRESAARRAGRGDHPRSPADHRDHRAPPRPPQARGRRHRSRRSAASRGAGDEQVGPGSGRCPPPADAAGPPLDPRRAGTPVSRRAVELGWTP